MSRLLVFLLLSLPLIGAYALFSLGLVVIYRASKVLNLAHGAMAMLAAYLTATMVERGIPGGIALVLGVVAGAGIGVGIERVFVRPLRAISTTAQTVGTVAALGLIISLVGKVWGTGGRPAPRVFPEGQIAIASSGVRYGEIGLFLVMLVTAGGLYALLQRTRIGLAMRGAADNPRAASLMGVDPDVATSAAWALGGATAALAGILLAAVTILHPLVLSLQAVPALVAALIGGLGSLPGAMIGAAIVGATQGLVPAVPALQRIEGSAQLVLAIVAFAVMAARGERYVATDVRGAVAGDRSRGGARTRLSTGRIFSAALAFAAFPWLPFVSFSLLGSANLAAYYALIAISLVVLVGWVGQISLGHAGLVGVGAYVTGHVVNSWHVTFPVNLLWAGVAGAAVAALLGAVAVRVRGLYLAVATLVFSWAAVEFLFRQEWFNSKSAIEASSFGEPGTFPYFDFSSRRAFFYLAWAVVLAAALLVANLRDSKTGRAFFAVRGSEVAAASLGISVVRTKVVAFAISGALAGVAGGLLIARDQVVTSEAFGVEVSLFFIAIAVVGGLTSISGAIAAAMLFAGLNELFFRLPLLTGWLEVVPPVLLTLVLLVHRGGLADLPHSLRDRASGPLAVLGPHWSRLSTPMQVHWSRAGAVIAARTSRLRSAVGTAGVSAVRPPAWRLDIAAVVGGGATDPDHGGGDTAGEAETAGAPPATGPAIVRTMNWQEVVLNPPVLPADRDQRKCILLATAVTVRFGGLLAVDNVSLSVRENEIVGLIGPNGAGKTTTFNAIAGLNSPVEGTIQMFDRDVTTWTVDERARIGVGRTFQAIQLLPQLTAFENLLIATHAHNGSTLLSNFVVGPSTLAHERWGREEVRRVASLLELEPYLDRKTGDLPFGLLRMVELGRALVTGSPLIMLDEPASGLDSTETERLGEILTFVRNMGVTLLLIEHDVRLVTSVSDYIYVLDRGALLSEGTPLEVQNDPRVIAAYLGEPPATTKEMAPV